MNSPLPWFIAGPLIGLIVPALLFLREKQFGISSSYRFIGATLLPKIKYFSYSKEGDRWQLQFAIGLVLSGLVVGQFFTGFDAVIVQPAEDYQQIALTNYEWKNALQFFIGGILVGFGARYANGCTAGHCIMGVSQFAYSSILATIAFFIGGLIGSLIINPIIF
jgi:uncharacterized membrane protein YedE/YeeE